MGPAGETKTGSYPSYHRQGHPTAACLGFLEWLPSRNVLPKDGLMMSSPRPQRAHDGLMISSQRSQREGRSHFRRRLVANSGPR